MSTSPVFLAGLSLFLQDFADRGFDDLGTGNDLCSLGLALMTAGELAPSSLTSPSSSLSVILLLIQQKEAERSALALASTRRGPYNIRKSMDSLTLLLDHGNDKFYRSFFRCSRPAFTFLVDTLSRNPIFQSTNPLKPQGPIPIQLATLLQTLGSTNKQSLHTAFTNGIGEGTVYLYCDRVCEAIQALRQKLVYWPNEGEEREEIKAHFAAHGFKHALGVGDGVIIPLAEMPRKDGMFYWCREKCFAISVLAICDHRGRFIYLDIGWPGSMNDVGIYQRSHISVEHWRFFGEDEYILVDKGYQLTGRTLVGFELDQLGVGREREVRKAWNVEFASQRIVIEHAFGAVKGRYPSLKMLQGRNLKRMFNLVETAMLLHNLFLDFGDHPGDIENYNPSDPLAEELQQELNPAPRFEMDLGGFNEPEVARRQRRRAEGETVGSRTVAGERARRESLRDFQSLRDQGLL